MNRLVALGTPVLLERGTSPLEDEYRVRSPLLPLISSLKTIHMKRKETDKGVKERQKKKSNSRKRK